MEAFIKLKQYISNSKKQIFKFLIVGASSAIIDLALLIFLKEKIGLTPVTAVAINQIFVILYNFLMNKYWSFETKKLPLKQFMRYLVLVAFNYCASIFLMFIFNHLLEINYQLVRIMSIAILFSFNFVIYKKWVYKEI